MLLCWDHMAINIAHLRMVLGAGERGKTEVIKSEINKQIARALGFAPLRVVTMQGKEVIETEVKWKYPEQFSDIANGMPQLLPDFVSIIEKFHEASKSKRFEIIKDQNSRPIDSDFE
ncbi:MAG: hypothetical protein ACE14T_04795 [Syntrophales bacterium]